MLAPEDEAISKTSLLPAVPTRESLTDGDELLMPILPLFLINNKLELPESVIFKAESVLRVLDAFTTNRLAGVVLFIPTFPWEFILILSCKVTLPPGTVWKTMAPGILVSDMPFTFTSSMRPRILTAFLNVVAP